MSCYPYMPLYIGDYLGDASHLTTLQHGAYLLLLMHYWRHGTALPDDDRKLARIAHLSESEWAEIRDDMAYFFQIGEGRWSHKRVEQELATALDRSEKARIAGKASGRARANPKRRTDVERTLNGCSTGVELEANQPSPSPEPSIVGGGGGTRASAREPDEDEFSRVHRLCCEAAGLTKARYPQNLIDVSPIMGLIRAGASLEDEILPALRSMKPNPNVRSWNYHLDHIRRFRANLEAAALDAPIPFPRAGPKRNPWIEANEQILREQREQTDGHFNGTTLDAVVEPGSEGDRESSRRLVARGV